jgi:hypothetical protein
MPEKTAARSRAETHFTASELRDSAVKEMMAKERAATDAKTVRLRALRLAKEEADRIAKAEHDALHPPQAAPRKKKIAAKRAAT